MKQIEFDLGHAYDDASTPTVSVPPPMAELIRRMAVRYGDDQIAAVLRLAWSIVLCRQGEKNGQTRLPAAGSASGSRCIYRDRVCTMKRRVTFTMDPAVSRRAKKLAHVRRTSVSALIEELLRSMPMASDRARTSFVKRWVGKFKTAKAQPGDLRMRTLKARYRLNRG